MYTLEHSNPSATPDLMPQKPTVRVCGRAVLPFDSGAVPTGGRFDSTNTESRHRPIIFYSWTSKQLSDYKTALKHNMILKQTSIVEGTMRLLKIKMHFRLTFLRKGKQEKEMPNYVIR